MIIPNNVKPSPPDTIRLCDHCAGESLQDDVLVEYHDIPGIDKVDLHSNCTTKVRIRIREAYGLRSIHQLEIRAKNILEGR